MPKFYFGTQDKMRKVLCCFNKKQIKYQQMKNIQIKAIPFFELLKIKDQSMWDLFAQMIDGEEKELIFLGEEGQVLFSYILPASLEKLQEDKTLFAQQYADKISKA